MGDSIKVEPADQPHHYTIKLTGVQRLAGWVQGRWVWVSPERYTWQYAEMERDAMNALQQLPAKDLRWIRCPDLGQMPAEPPQDS